MSKSEEENGSYERFSGRVLNYAKYRPGYPQDLFEFLHKEARLETGSLVVDIGSGTGLLAELFLRNGCTVSCIEPNREMREMGETLLSRYPRFSSSFGKADSTGLTDGAADLIVVGQAFHWFDVEAARKEFARILKPGRLAALIWNNRKAAESGLMHDYQELLSRHCPDYKLSPHRDYDEDNLRKFFRKEHLNTACFDNRQSFDLQGFKGRLLSSSYVPAEGEAHDLLMQAMEKLFDRFNRDGKVEFIYDTVVYYDCLVS